MKKTNSILFLLCTLIFPGCADRMPDKDLITHDFQNKREEDTISGIDIYDFYFINRAPAATEKHPLDELIKIYFSTKSVAIDVENKELLENPRFATNGVTIFEDPLPFDDKEGLIEILEKYRVQEWKEDYTTEDPDSYQDGYGWMMLLQFEDGTIERYKGSGPYKEDVVPKNFDEFASEMEAFKKEKIREGSK